jgi:hypothetical protein
VTSLAIMCELSPSNASYIRELWCVQDRAGSGLMKSVSRTCCSCEHLFRPHVLRVYHTAYAETEGLRLQQIFRTRFD